MKIIAALAVGLALAIQSIPANALNLRSFVSPTGSDANNCSLVAPCRTFQAAHDATATSGEVAVLGTAGYGTLAISKAISIVNPGAFEAGITVNSGGTGIVINAGASDVVSLRGLTIEGGNAGDNGIRFNSGKALFIDNCIVEKFFGSAGHGILIQPTSGTMTIAIKNTTLSYNGGAGFKFQPPAGSPAATILIDHVTAIGNQVGIYIGTAFGGSARASIINSVASANDDIGILSNYSVSVSIDNVNITGNNATGIFAGNNAFVFLGRSTIENNVTFGINNQTSPNNFYSHQNNHILGNGTDIVNGGLKPAPPL